MPNKVIKLPGKILESLHQTIVIVNNLAYDINSSSYILNRDKARCVCDKNICILLANDIMLTSMQGLQSLALDHP